MLRSGSRRGRLVLGVFMFRVFGTFSVLTFRMLVARRRVLRFFVGDIRFSFFMSCVCFCFRYFACGKRLLSIATFLSFSVLRFLLAGLAGGFSVFGAVNFVGFLGLFFLFQVGINATNFGVRFGVSLNFLVLGFDQTGRERGRLFFAE
jgi:hypothetical protein